MLLNSLTKKKVETNDAQTTRRPPMVHLDPDGRGGVALECFGQVLEAVSKHSTQVPKADHTHV